MVTGDLEQKAAQLRAMARRMRLEGLEMAWSTGRKGAHLGGGFSCIEILAVLYGAVMRLDPAHPLDENRDRLLSGKNHFTLAHFPALCERGFISRDELLEFQKDGGRLTGYPRNVEIGLEYSGGSLGQALSVGIGMAMGMRRKGSTGRVFVLVGDGELDEGQVWEGVMSAPQFQLSNLVLIVDRNHLSYDGDTEELMPLESLDDKFNAFRWRVQRCNGHDTLALLKAFNSMEGADGPCVLIADTVKGKGVSFIENRPEWHHHALTKEQYEQAKAEIMAED